MSPPICFLGDSVAQAQEAGLGPSSDSDSTESAESCAKIGKAGTTRGGPRSAKRSFFPISPSQFFFFLQTRAGKNLQAAC